MFNTSQLSEKVDRKEGNVYTSQLSEKVDRKEGRACALY